MLNREIVGFPKLSVFREGLQITQDVFVSIHPGREEARCLLEGIRNSK
jgi:hypothetical protein